ncbi:hypothetical protein [Actinopolymorpha pittospori]|uniref:Uncharacterized protein n=1 Tax=Actinopolymorpha pittospori TaxID=648752 RepID=A0A927MZL7_9ACTN|nr:hypothetical protein [Actinopolymorpha pittospori]MBE1609891.1 hypothetical protein [Actinopolymorpha pittospori]
MTAEWFDLGQRLRAATTRQLVPRLLHAPISTASRPVACRARLSGGHVTVTVAAAGQPQATATGPDALDLLGSVGVTLAATSPATLVTDDPATLGLLYRLALIATADSEQDTVAAHIAWWRDRADFPGGRAVVDTSAACRARWVLEPPR